MASQADVPSLFPTPPLPGSSSSLFSSSSYDVPYKFCHHQPAIKAVAVQLDHLSLQEPDLMTHWRTSTYLSFVKDRFSRHMWQTAIPEMSLQHSYLRHAILALTTVQLALSINDARIRRGYLESARAHQIQARADLKPILKNVDGGNRIAVFASLCIFVLYEFPFHLGSHYNRNADILYDLCKVLQSCRESIAVLREVARTDRDGQLRPLMITEEGDANMPNMSRLAILMLQRQNASLDKTDPQHKHNTAAYEETIAYLGNALESLTSGNEGSVAAFRWISRSPAQFITLLEERQPFALVILAHYAVILHNLRKEWWMAEWGDQILREVCRCLGPQWLQSITWVIDATGFCAFGL